MKTLTFVFSGDAAGAAGDELKAVLAAFEPGVEVVTKERAELPGPTRKAIDLIALAALIVSIPSAVLAVTDIADRIEKRRRAQKLIDKAKRLRAETAVEILIVDGTVCKPLDTLTPDAILDIARNA